MWVSEIDGFVRTAFAVLTEGWFWRIDPPNDDVRLSYAYA